MSRPTRDDLWMAIYDWREAKSRCEPAEAAELAVDAAWSDLYNDLMDAERDLAETRRLLALAEAVVAAALDLRRSGYDGPWIGDVCEPLFSALAAWDRRNETSGKQPLRNGPCERAPASPLADRVPGESADSEPPGDQ